MLKKIIYSTLMLPVSFASASTVADFDDLTLSSSSFNNGGPVTNSNGFVSRGAQFGNSYNSDFGGYWSGFAYSNVNAPNTSGFTNQYASRAGPAFSGSNYAVAYSGSNATINLPGGTSASSVRVTNTAYTAFDMKDGSSFSKKFGGVTGNDADFLDVIFTGHAAPNATGGATGAVTFRLADYTSANNADDYIVSTWQLLDLSALGTAASIKLSWASSDVGTFGINTPTYVAIDDFTVIPEPTALSLLAIGSVMVLRRRR